MTKRGVAIGAIVGAVAGLVAGVLTAPKSGKETRADIKAKADELKSHAEAKKDEVVKKAEELKSRAEDKLRDGFDNLTK